MNEEEIDREIRSTLKDIFDYLGVASLENDATIRTFIKRLIKKVTQS